MTDDTVPDDHETSDETRRRLAMVHGFYGGESGEEMWRPRLGVAFTMEDATTASGQCLFFFYSYRRSFPTESREAEKRAWDAAGVERLNRANVAADRSVDSSG
jgi:hypothetical protein